MLIHNVFPVWTSATRWGICFAGVLAAGCLCFTVVSLTSLGAAAQESMPHNAPPADYGKLLHDAEDARARGSVTEAKAALQAATRLQPDAPAAWCDAGELAGEAGNFGEAETLLRRCVDLAPKQARAHYLLGVSAIADPSKKLDWEAADKEFCTAASLQSPYPEALARLGQGLIATGKPDEAVTVLAEAARQAPGSAVISYQLGSAYEALLQTSQAEAAYRKALTLNPRQTDAAVSLAKLLVDAGKAAEAVPLLVGVLSRNPDLQSAHYILSRANRMIGKRDAAADEIQISKQLRNRESNAVQATQLSNAALQLAAQGDMFHAEQKLCEAIRRNPAYGVAHYNLALILADQQKLKEARQEMVQAVSLLPGNAKPLFELSRIDHLLDHPADEVRELLWAVRLDPQSVNIRSALANAERKSSTTLVVEDLPSAWSDAASGHLELGRELLGAGDAYGAAGQALYALARSPADVPARTLLGQAYEQAGDRENALEEYRKLQCIDPHQAGLQAKIDALTASLAAHSVH